MDISKKINKYLNEKENFPYSNDTLVNMIENYDNDDTINLLRSMNLNDIADKKTKILWKKAAKAVDNLINYIDVNNIL